MVRRIIRIDEEKCSGCGLCATACHEGAIEMVNGKAKLTKENYCDGLGDCLPACPEGAISFEMREAPEYEDPRKSVSIVSSGAEVHNWPVQIKLAPVSAPYFSKANLLIAADCTAFVCSDIRDKLASGRVILIGCPKLDGVDYSVKLSEILSKNDICSIIVARMEVPCCGGLEYAVRRAVEMSGKNIETEIITVSTRGIIK